MTLPEQAWRAQVTRLGLQLMSAGARAAYQAQLPLGLAASLDLGCVAAVRPAARTRGLGEGFELGELQVRAQWLRARCMCSAAAFKPAVCCRHAVHALALTHATCTHHGVPLPAAPNHTHAHTLQAKPAAECPYLEGEGPEGLGAALRYVSLYHSSDGARGRGLFCLLLPATQRCHMVLLVPAGIAAKEVAAHALERVWRELLAGLQEQGMADEQQVRLGRLRACTHAWLCVARLAASAAGCMQLDACACVRLRQACGSYTATQQPLSSPARCWRLPCRPATHAALWRTTATDQVASLSGLEFNVEYAREHLAALRTIQRALASYREQQRGPCVAACQAPGGSARLQQDMPLLADLPCVDKPAAPEDAK